MSTVIPGSAAVPHFPEGSVVAIGNFDGVHLGHRSVLSAVRTRAALLGARAMVYTFEPAPTAVVAPTRHQARITTLATRVRRLAEAGAELVVVEPFDQPFASIEAQSFAEEILVRRLGARAVAVGHDFRFGRGRLGDAERLRAWMPGLEVMTLEAVEAEGAPISSSRIRKLLAAGDVAAAARLLGHPSTLGGPVVHGDGRGRTIGLPTANLVPREELIPGFGVYAVYLRRGRDRWPGVCNIGTRPTFSGTSPSVEVHLLDVSVDLYGAEVELDLVDRIRAEQRFSGVEALVTQIRADILRARSILS